LASWFSLLFNPREKGDYILSEALVHVWGTSDPYFRVLKMLKTNKDVVSDVYQKTCKQSVDKTNVYFELHENDKSVDLSITFSNIRIYQILSFYVAHNKKNIALRFYMLVGYIISKVQNCFQFFKNIEIFFKNFHIERSLEHRV
jgi:hypothetical protein